MILNREFDGRAIDPGKLKVSNYVILNREFDGRALDPGKLKINPTM